MPIMQQVAKDAPLMIAWEAYRATEGYANTKRWATKPEHTDGSLWAAFVAGFNAPKPAGVDITEEMVERARPYLKFGAAESFTNIEMALTAALSGDA